MTYRYRDPQATLFVVLFVLMLLFAVAGTVWEVMFNIDCHDRGGIVLNTGTLPQCVDKNFFKGAP